MEMLWRIEQMRLNKRRLFSRIAAGFLAITILCICIPAYAEQGTAFTLRVNGYVPVVDEAAGTVTIALPLTLLVPPANISNLTATLDLGSPNSAPFIFSTYQMSLGNGISASGNEYTIQAAVPLKSTRNNGQYPIAVQLSYVEGGATKTQDFIVYVTINKGIDPNATPVPVTETEEPEVPTLEKLLQIDNGRIYPGMNSSYAGGYMPDIVDGTCYVVLPLYATQRISHGRITATLDYGDPTASPFIFNNVQQTIPQQSLNGGALYLLSFGLPLKNDRVNGTYPLVIKTEYTGWTGQDIVQDFTVYVTIKDGKDPSEAEKEEINFKPPVYVESYAVDPSIVNAGSDFTIQCNIKNASAEDTVRNMKVSFKGENTELIPSGDSNTLFIDKLARGDSKAITLQMRTMPDAKAQPHKVLLSIEYEDAKAATLNVEDELIVQVKQPIRLEYDEPTLAASLNAGDTISFTMQVRNMGKSKLNNVLVKLDVPGLLPDSSAYLGNMDAGTSKTAEMVVFIGMKTMTTEGGTESSDSEKYGYTQGKLLITYEDEYGEQFSEEVALSTTINAPIIPERTPEPEVEEPKASQWWISLLIGGTLLAAGLTTFILRKRKRYRQVTTHEME